MKLHRPCQNTETRKEKHRSELLAGECQRQTYMKKTYQSYTETLEQS